MGDLGEPMEVEVDVEDGGEKVLMSGEITIERPLTFLRKFYDKEEEEEGGENKDKEKGPPPQGKEKSPEEKDFEYALKIHKEEEAGSSKRMSLRSRENRVMLNEDYLFHHLVLPESSKKTFKAPKAPVSRQGSRLSAGSTESGSSGSAKKKGRGRPRLRKDGNGNGNGKQPPQDYEVDSEAPETYLRQSGRTADWDMYLHKSNKYPENLYWVAPVDKFPNAPLSEVWKEFAKTGVRVEIPNIRNPCVRPVYWVGTIRFFAGYKALVQYECLGASQQKPMFAWMSYCSSVPKPIGYCQENDILLFPPFDVLQSQEWEQPFRNFLELLNIVMEEKPTDTVRSDHIDIVGKAIVSKQKYKIGEIVEVVDCVTGNTADRLLGKVTGIIADRVHVSYVGVPKNSDRAQGFWFNVHNDGIRPLGWCQEVGLALPSYVPKGVKFPKIDPSLMPPPVPDDLHYGHNSVCELIHPYHVDRIATGQIERIYNHGYVLMNIKCNAPWKSTRFVFHITSPWLLECGFAERNEIPLALPAGEVEGKFEWKSYCSQRGLQPLDLSCITRRTNPFRAGEKFEAIDLRQPTFCGPVTVMKVAEHLIFLHFDGWRRDEPESLQWAECDSPDIYPAGWAEMVGQEFQGYPERPREEDRGVQLSWIRQVYKQQDNVK